MNINKLELYNFASFFDKHEIEFNSKPEKPVTIIIGGGGFGKTSIFDAINWSLYGEKYEPVLKREKEKTIEDYANETALGIARENNHGVEISCSLFFEHESKQYRIHRAVVVIQDQGKHKSRISDRTSSLYEIMKTGNFSEIKHIDSFMDEILPSNVRDYFLFNGDRINELSLPGSSEAIRDGVYRVVDLELLQKGIEHLAQVAKTFRAKAKRASTGEMENIEEEYSQHHQDLEDLKFNLNNKLEEKRSIEDLLEILENKLRELEVTVDLQKRRDTLKIKLDSTSDKYKSTLVLIKDTAAIAALNLAMAPLEKLEEKLKEKKGKGEIPSSISENLLEEIIEIRRCICGTEFEDGDNQYEELKRKLNEEKIKKGKGENLLDLFFEIRNAKGDIKSAKLDLVLLGKDRAKYDQEIIEIDKELKEILDKLKNIPEENISGLVNNFTEGTKDLERTKRRIFDIKKSISDKDIQIKQLQIKREQMGQQQEKVRKFQLRDKLAQDSAEELEKIFEKFAEDSRKEIEIYTREEFEKFIPSANALKVGISPEFHYDVVDQNGNPALQQLSMGQKQALSLAYITSISRVSEKNPPLVIDMPFGRLDGDVQVNIAKGLPELSSQVILMLLPNTEWNEKTKPHLKSKASAIYELAFDKKNRQTTIKEL
jgi:DNA sulfur modification protein DndD